MTSREGDDRSFVRWQRQTGEIPRHSEAPLPPEPQARDVVGNDAFLAKVSTSEAMNQTSPGARGVFDLEKAVRSCFGKHDFFQQMVGFLFEEADPLLDEMRTRTRSGDAEAVVRAAHRLGNTLVYLGATPATDATKRLEAIGRSGNLKEAAGALDELARRLVQLMEALAPLRIRASG